MTKPKFTLYTHCVAIRPNWDSKDISYITLENQDLDLFYLGAINAAKHNDEDARKSLCECYIGTVNHLLRNSKQYTKCTTCDHYDDDIVHCDRFIVVENFKSAEFA